MKYIVSVAISLILIGCDKGLSQAENTEDAVITPSYLEGPMKGKVGRSGLYRMLRSGGVVNNPNTSTGKAISRPVVQLVKKTDRIPLIIGAQMYMQYRMWPFPKSPAYVELRRVLKHPPMTLPDGSISTGSDFMLKRKVSSNQVISYTGYSFDEDYELVAGDWNIEIWYKDEKLIEQKFTTYSPTKEEVAKLIPLLNLGNNVFSQVSPANNGKAKANWQRVVVKPNSNQTIPGLSELQQAINDPFAEDISN